MLKLEVEAGWRECMEEHVGVYVCTGRWDRSKWCGYTLAFCFIGWE